MKKQTKTLFFISCAIYCVSAMFVCCFGQASTSIMESLSISQSKQGAILTYGSVGGIITSIYLSLYGERFSKIKTIVLGSIMLAIGCVLIFAFSFLFNPYTYIFLSLMLANIGYTIIDLTMNSMISEVYAHNKNKYIPIIHTFYALGSMFIPIFYLASTSYANKNHYAYAYLSLGVIAFIITLFFIKDINKTNISSQDKKIINDPYEIFKTSRAWLLLLSALLFAIFQTAFQSWISNYNLCVLKLDSNFSGIIITSFFTGALIMRLLSTKLLNRIKNYDYYFVCAAISGICLILSMYVSNHILYMLLLVISGFFSGGLVPTFMIVATDSFPDRQSSSSSIFILAIGISNLLSKTYGLIIENYSHKLLMIIIGISLIISGITIKTLDNKKTS